MREGERCAPYFDCESHLDFNRRIVFRSLFVLFIFPFLIAPDMEVPTLIVLFVAWVGS
jgi:hypothetical protein